MNVESIKQKPRHALEDKRLPDFRNFGVLLRVLLLVNLLALVTVLIGHDVGELPRVLPDMAGRVEPPLLALLLLLYAFAPVLQRRSYRTGVGWVLCAAVIVAIVSRLVLQESGEGSGRWAAWAAGAVLLSLLYFDYRSLRLSPALGEARVIALTSRIRPHFLFNALNGVLGVIRSDPRRAEVALEELAELFRVLMKDNRELVPLSDELTLCRRYVDVESLRLGDRLLVKWDIDPKVPRGALVPPLLLQPLVENAIYHGIEPAAFQGEVLIRIVLLAGSRLYIAVDNPVVDGQEPRSGNRMALSNIRERLMLFFDLEARLEVLEGNGRYRVAIRLPCRRRRKQ